MKGLLDVSAVLVVLMAAVGWLNARFTKLPVSVAMLSAGVLAAGALYCAQTWIGPFWGYEDVRAAVAHFDFPGAVLDYFLAFLLFAAGMNTDLRELRRRVAAVLTLASAGVVVSTLLMGFGLWWLAGLLHIALPLPWALVFGALISPTDPVAVTAALEVHDGETPNISDRLSAVLQGESLFNDGFGLVVFGAALAFAASGDTPSLGHIAGSAFYEAACGMILGWALSWVAVFALRAVDDYVTEVTLTLALALGVYALAHMLHGSGPIAAATAGLMAGHHGHLRGFSAKGRRYVDAFWELIDSLLNALLFLLVGLQVMVVAFRVSEIGLVLAALVLGLLARLIVILPWGAYFRFKHEERGPSLILAWGGLRGAISLALALSIHDTPYRPLLLTLTFSTVAFSVILQGLTFRPLTKWLAKGAPA